MPEIEICWRTRWTWQCSGSSRRRPEVVHRWSERSPAAVLIVGRQWWWGRSLRLVCWSRSACCHCRTVQTRLWKRAGEVRLLCWSRISSIQRFLRNCFQSKPETGQLKKGCCTGCCCWFHSKTSSLSLDFRVRSCKFFGTYLHVIFGDLFNHL